MISNKFFGSILIVVGTTLGAGMLALPLVSASAGFSASVLLLVTTWALMLYTGFLILEINLHFDLLHNSFATMAETTLGAPGKMITLVSGFLLLYALLSAYISGGASLLSTLFEECFNCQPHHAFFAILFTILLGSFVFWSTRAVDRLNQGLLSIKGALLFITLLMLTPHIQMVNLEKQPINHHWLFSCAPIFLCAFGFHHVIPSLTNYIGKQPKTLKKILWWGLTIPLIIYLFWLLVAFGVLPYVKPNNSVGQFVDMISDSSHNHFVALGIHGFSNIAMTTSFLGVALGLFDLLADTAKRSNTKRGRFQTALFTFIPPLIFAIFFKRGFVMALGYAAIFVAILEIILPALMVIKMRKHQQESNHTFMAPGNRYFLTLILIIGIVIIGFQLINL